MSAPYAAPPPPDYGYPPGRPPKRPKRANMAGIIVAAVGGAMAVIGGLVDWYDNSITVGDIVHALDNPNAKAFPQAWLGYLMWIVLALTVVGALFANVPGPLSTPLRIVTPIVAVAGAGGTAGALTELLPGSVSFTDHSQPGLWMMIIGLLVAGVAAIFGPSNVRPMPYAPGYPPPYAMPQ